MVAEPRARLKRKDGLPENTPYADTGCSESPTCLTCPLVICRYDVRTGLRGVRALIRQQAVRDLRAELKITEISAQVGISQRQVYRHLSAGV